MTKTTMTSITGPSKNNPGRKIGTVPDPEKLGLTPEKSGIPNEGSVPNFSVESGLQGTVPDLRTERSEVVESGLSPLLRNNRAITLMEILVVIVIISVLAAVLLPAVTTGLKKSYVRKAETTIATLQSALEMYKRDWGNYPVSTYDTTQRNGNQGGLVSSLTGSIKLNGTADTPKRGQPYMTFKKGDLNSTSTILLDPWGNAYIYIAREYVTNWSSMTFDNVSGSYGPFWTNTADVNQNTYNIFSLGPDGKANGYTGGADTTHVGKSTGNYDVDLFNDPADGNGGKTGSYLGDSYNDDDLNSWSGQ